MHQHLDWQSEQTASADEYQVYMRACGVDWLLLSNPAAAPVALGGADLDETDANLACLATGRLWSRLLPLYWARVGGLDSHPAALIGALNNEPFSGVVLPPPAPMMESETAVALYKPYLSTLAQLEISALFHVEPASSDLATQIISLAKSFSRVPFVLSGFGGTRHWRAALETVHLAVRRNELRCYLDTAGARATDILQAIKTHGANWLVFGSGGTLLNEDHARTCRQTLEELYDHLATVDFELFASVNARDLFKLPSD
ncbi:MAG: hypothetical protein ABIG44_13855 [Planctomycetota bacterium]